MNLLKLITQSEKLEHRQEASRALEYYNEQITLHHEQTNRQPIRIKKQQSGSNYISKPGKSDHFSEEMMFTNFGSRANAEEYGRTPKSKKTEQLVVDDKNNTNAFADVMLDNPPEPLTA